jgi:hypothetical protein
LRKAREEAQSGWIHRDPTKNGKSVSGGSLAEEISP